VKVEVDDCGCKQFECHDKNPRYCKSEPVECGPCEQLEQSEDECGCPVDKCVPLPKPVSKCPCQECQMCSQIETGPTGCGLMQGVCIRKPCKEQPEVVCDPECEKVEFHEDRCGCMSYGCKKLDNSTIPICDECYEAKQRRIARCDINKYECVPKQCKGPASGQEVCFDLVKEKMTKCGCPIFKKKQCSLVPAGDCPVGTVAQGGFDLCGCPHQICVPCQQVYPDETCERSCEKQEKTLVANGQCEQMVCVPTPECDCPKADAGPCAECEVKGKIRLSKHCVVETCVPSKAKHCVCKGLLEKADKACGKCEVSKRVKKGPCAGIKACTAKAASDCPKLGTANCPACEKAAVVTDECGCSRYRCIKRTCAPVSKDPIDCEKNKLKKKSTIGLDSCGCSIQTCVNEEKICDKDSFPPEYGTMFFRNEKYSGVDSLSALKVKTTPNVKTGPGFENLRPLKAAWVNRQFTNNWNAQFSGDKFTKVRFTFWKREENAMKPVVDIIFNAKNSNIDQWFMQDKVFQIVHGPNVRTRHNYNFWSSTGDATNKRHFFLSKNYGGCNNDAGLICVADRVDACNGHWMGGKGWNSFPRFLYSSSTNGCKWRDTNCAKEADVFTISAL